MLSFAAAPAFDPFDPFPSPPRANYKAARSHRLRTIHSHDQSLAVEAPCNNGDNAESATTTAARYSTWEVVLCSPPGGPKVISELCCAPAAATMSSPSPSDNRPFLAPRYRCLGCPAPVNGPSPTWCLRCKADGPPRAMVMDESKETVDIRFLQPVCCRSDHLSSSNSCDEQKEQHDAIVRSSASVTCTGNKRCSAPDPAEAGAMMIDRDTALHQPSSASPPAANANAEGKARPRGRFTPYAYTSEVKRKDSRWARPYEFDANDPKQLKRLQAAEDKLMAHLTRPLTPSQETALIAFYGYDEARYMIYIAKQQRRIDHGVAAADRNHLSAVDVTTST